MKLIWGDFTAPQNLGFSKFYAFSRGHNFGYKSDRIVKQSAFDVKWAEKQHLFNALFSYNLYFKSYKTFNIWGPPPPP